jgi:hypothetical protein
MTRPPKLPDAVIAIALTVSLGACTEPHSSAQQEFMPDDCTACHSGSDALVHPEAKFPLMTQGTFHDNIECYDCHHFNRGPGILGFHADCTELCHLENQNSSVCLSYPQSAANTMLCQAVDPLHVGLTNPTTNAPYAWDPVNHDFCLSCHPNGLLP